MKAFFAPLVSTEETAFLFTGSVLLLPAVSIGSVPQLAVDLLLNEPKLQLRKIGRIDPSFCIPFAGPAERAAGDTAGKDSLATALEVYANGQGLVVVQQRAPVLKARQSEFLPSLSAWIRQSAFSETLWISSIDAAARTDAELETPILTLSLSGKPTTPVLGRLAAMFPAFSPQRQQDRTSTDIPHIPGALLTRRFLQSSPPNTAAILYFAAEGDTRPHAHALASTIISHLLNPALPSHTTPHTPAPHSFAEPHSWQFLFGNPPDTSLYG